MIRSVAVHLFLPFLVLFVLTGCGGADPKTANELQDLRVEHEKLKQELAKLQTTSLEGEEFLDFPKDSTAITERVIFYKIPYASTPYLTFPDGMVCGYKVTDEKAESFKLQRVLPEEKGAVTKVINGVEVTESTIPLREIYVQSKFKWKAEGRPAK